MTGYNFFSSPRSLPRQYREGSGSEWLRGGFVTPVYAAGVRVHETYNSVELIGMW